MTGVSLGIKTFMSHLSTDRNKIDTLLNLGVEPRKILLPYVNQALETALLPTLNSMLSMGIISLPGMMTGQILSGTLPLTAIMYQIAIMVAICTAVCLSVFLSLTFGYKSLYNHRHQIMLP
jgi:putative ABC transport system permease protein